MHHQIKLIERNRRKKEKKEKKNYLLHERTLLCERIFQDSKKFIQFSLKPKIFFLQKRNSQGQSLQNVINVREREKKMKRRARKKGGGVKKREKVC